MSKMKLVVDEYMDVVEYFAINDHFPNNVSLFLESYLEQYADDFMRDVRLQKYANAMNEIDRIAEIRNTVNHQSESI